MSWPDTSTSKSYVLATAMASPTTPGNCWQSARHSQSLSSCDWSWLLTPIDPVRDCIPRPASEHQIQYSAAALADQGADDPPKSVQAAQSVHKPVLIESDEHYSWSRLFVMGSPRTAASRQSHYPFVRVSECSTWMNTFNWDSTPAGPEAWKNSIFAIRQPKRHDCGLGPLSKTPSSQSHSVVVQYRPHGRGGHGDSYDRM